MNREHELKPCPFCGSANLKSGGDDKHVGYWCSECGSAGPNHYDSRYDWNRRAALEPAPKAQPLDLSNLLRHAFSCGYNSAAGEGGWEDYDPTACQAYHRIRAALSAPKAEAVEPVDYQWREGRSTRHAPDEWDWSPWHAGRLPAHVENRKYLRYEERALYTSPVPALTDEAVERAMEVYNCGIVKEQSDRTASGVVFRYKPKDAMRAAFPSKGGGE